MKKIMKDCAFIIQARLGSTRLPNKMLLPFFQNKGVFEIVLEKLLINYPTIPLILATSINSENDALESVANKYNIKVYRGSEDDVLSRFIEAADVFGISKIIRVCSDNPFLDILELHKLFTYISTHSHYDYVSFLVNGKPSIVSHFGFWAEYVTLNSLKEVVKLTSENIYHEHVTNYIYNNTGIFDVKLLKTNSLLEGCFDIRMTLDTKEDFLVLSTIYSDMCAQYGNNFGIDELIKYLDQNPSYRQQMNEQIKQNTK